MPRSDVEPTPPPPAWLQPASAILVLGVDWLFFGAEIITLETGWIVASLAAFAITAAGVYWIQRTRAHDAAIRALLKALLCGAVAGLPTSIGGTVLGTAVLALAGLTRWRRVRGPQDRTRSTPG